MQIGSTPKMYFCKFNMIYSILPPYLTSFMVTVARFLERSLCVGIIFYLTHLALHIIST